MCLVETAEGCDEKKMKKNKKVHVMRRRIIPKIGARVRLFDFAWFSTGRELYEIVGRSRDFIFVRLSVPSAFRNSVPIFRVSIDDVREVVQ